MTPSRDSYSRCDGCGADIPYGGRGRPRRWCTKCREANREKVAAQQRAYYEANKGEIAAKRRAYREAKKVRRGGLLCAACGERLRHPSEDGLCGFCRLVAP